MSKSQIREMIDQELDGLYRHLYAIENEAGQEKNIADLERLIADLKNERSIAGS